LNSLFTLDEMTIAVDFDGTCVTHSFPELGVSIGAQHVLRQLVDKGHQLILWTMRCDGQEQSTSASEYEIHAGDYLAQAIKWFEDNDIPLYGIQRNPSQDNWTSSPKCYAQLYIDDAALGCPLKFVPTVSDRPFADWAEIEKLLIQKGIL